jgi:hypothetical protein
MPTINWLAVLAATAVSFLLGGVWYGAFGQTWLEALNRRKEDLPKGPVPYITAALGSFVNAAMLACFIQWLDHDPERQWNIGHGLALGAATALGFLGASTAKHYAFANWPTKLFAIDFGVDLIGFMLMGAILTAWR